MTTSAEETSAVPAHVPPELRWDHSIDSFPAGFADPYVGACDAIHAGPDIVWATKGAYTGRPGWMLTRFAHLQEVHFDPERFAAAESRDAAVLLGFDLPLIPFESDPPMHRHYRQLLQPWFQPSAVNAMEPMIRSICDELIAQFADRGGCEFVGEFSTLLPSHVFLELMGLPRAMLGQFLAWENGFLRGQSLEEKAAAMRAIHAYFRDYLAEKRKAPGSDLVSTLAGGEIEGRPLTEAEVLGMCIVLYIGGLDSVASGLGWYLRHLARDRELQDRLRRAPELIPLAVDELSRAYATNCTMRTVIQDTEFHGVPMRKGDIVALPTFFSARDPREYVNPHVIDIDRKAASMTFGTGVHLAKREIRIVLAEFLARFREIRIAPGESEVWTTQTIWGVKKLPLAWER